jgi:hypothetical protein
MDGCAQGGGLIEGTLDCRKREAIAFLTSRRQEARSIIGRGDYGIPVTALHMRVASLHRQAGLTSTYQSTAVRPRSCDGTPVRLGDRLIPQSMSVWGQSLVCSRTSFPEVGSRQPRTPAMSALTLARADVRRPSAGPLLPLPAVFPTARGAAEHRPAPPH